MATDDKLAQYQKKYTAKLKKYNSSENLFVNLLVSSLSHQLPPIWP
jgi:hypothetical protein